MIITYGSSLGFFPLCSVVPEPNLAVNVWLAACCISKNKVRQMSELGPWPAKHPHRSALQQSTMGEASGQARSGSKLNIQWLLTMHKPMEGKWCVRSHSAHPMSELNTHAPLDRRSARKSPLKKEWLGATAQLQPVSLRCDAWFVPRWRAAGLKGF